MRRPFALLWKHRRMLFQTTRNELRARYAGSALGLAWLVVYPLLLLGAYASVFVFVLNREPVGLESPIQHVALIFAGLIPFLGFAESLGSGAASVASAPNLIKNTLFPIELVPVKSVLVSQAVQVVGTVILVLALPFLGKLSVWILLVPLIWVLQLMFTIGLIWIVSSASVYLRDIPQIITIVTLMLMMASPIASAARLIEGPLAAISLFNPLYYIIACQQDCMIFGQAPPAHAFFGLCVMGFGMFFLGHWFFDRMKLVLVDNV